MKSPLRILHLEDTPRDAELCRGLLEREGLPLEIVLAQNAAEFHAALAHGGFDVILADYSLPDYDGLRALAHAREVCPAVPFIFVSGELGEEAAIEALKSGATDYVLKMRLSRLVPAIRRAVAETEARAERQVMEQRLRQAEKLASLGQLAASVASQINVSGPAAGRTGQPAQNPFSDFSGLLENYEKLLEAAKGEGAAPALVVEAEAARAQVNERVVLNLCKLLVALADFKQTGEPAPPAAGTAEAEPPDKLLAALQETIEVLEKTKRSFKSKALGQLRAKLEALVHPHP